MKVEVESNGTEKSYKATELVVITKSKHVVRKKKQLVVNLMLPNHIRKAARVCFDKHLRHEQSRVMHIKRASSMGVSNLSSSSKAQTNSPRTWLDFNHVTLSCFCYVAQITRISLVSLARTVQERHSKINARMRT